MAPDSFSPTNRAAIDITTMAFLKVTKGNDDQLYPCGSGRMSVRRFAGSIRIEPLDRGEGCPEAVTLPDDADKVYLVENGVTVTGWVWPPKTGTSPAVAYAMQKSAQPAKETP